MKFRFQYIYTAFLLSFVILTVLSVLFYNRLMSANRFSDDVEHSYETLNLLSKDEAPLITITNEKIIGKKISDAILSVFGGTLFYKISVADNGMGFSNEFADKIFQLFQKLDPQHFSYQSKGIGLAMVQRIMINHGGNVTASGSIGKGAVFYLYFPIPGH